MKYVKTWMLFRFQILSVVVLLKLEKEQCNFLQVVLTALHQKNEAGNQFK